MSALFTPAKLRDVALPNRIVVSPMSQYSAENGSATDWHLMHLGQFAVSGAGLLIVEATNVEPEGRITHRCLGLYSDENEAALARIVAFCKTHSDTPIGVQIAHAGRKGSTKLPWEGRAQPLSAAEGAWETLSCSGIPRAEGWPAPRAMTQDDLTRIRDAHAAAVTRAARIGFDLIEFNAAHGYLIHEFLSPLTNRREDAYGGSREARFRYPLEVFRAMRAAWPADKPMGVRVSATDYAENGWTLDDTVAFCAALKAEGCDYAAVSSGGLVLEQSIPIGEGHQVEMARTVRDSADIPVMAVGMIQRPRHAEEIISSGSADFVAIARGILHDPHWPWHAAAVLGAEVGYPPQYIRAYKSKWHRNMRMPSPESGGQS